MVPDQAGCFSGETHTGHQLRGDTNEPLPSSNCSGMTVVFKGRAKAEQKHRNKL